MNLNNQNNQNNQNFNSNTVQTNQNVFVPLDYSSYYIYPPPMYFQPFLPSSPFGAPPFQIYANNFNIIAPK